MSDLFTEQLKSLQLSERRSAAGGTHNAAEWLNLTRPSDFCRNMTALSVSASSLDNAVSDLSCPSSFSPLPRLSPSTAIPLLSLRRSPRTLHNRQERAAGSAGSQGLPLSFSSSAVCLFCALFSSVEVFVGRGDGFCSALTFMF